MKNIINKILVLILVLLCEGFICCDVKCDVIAGEKITYHIKKMGINAGKAVIEYKGLQKYNDQDFILLSVNVKGFNFFDNELIYLDKDLFYPRHVVRDINIFGKKEKINEEYLQEKGIINIEKIVGTEKTTMSIQKKGAVDNIYGFIYKYRIQGKFRLGEELSMNLPTQEVTLTLKSKEKVNYNNTDFDAYYMEGNPKGVKVWFDSLGSHIPLQIDGAMGFGKTSMVFDKIE